MSVLFVIKCDGAAVDGSGTRDWLTECNKTFPTHASAGYETRQLAVEAAWRAGWKVGPNGDAMCPKCGAPDEKTLRFIEQFGLARREVVS